MADSHHPDDARRRFLRGLALAPLVLATPTIFLARDVGLAEAMSLPPTPACGDDDDDDPTPPQIEGPFFKPRSPRRTSLVEPPVAGAALAVTGRVLDTDCRPIANALLDVWQCDAAGHYDNAGFTLRGHQFTDHAGRYRLETIVPGLYPGRTRHIHIKVQAANRPALTTQLYFAGEPGNRRDRIFDPRLTLRGIEGDRGGAATFDFVLDLR
ncbi:MAG TPA: hypothetical protein VMM18_10690 [Gemmatimonadaceae bacterium]|nr:hypothetical protein [Gemmatimonadaceae bacterium]